MLHLIYILAFTVIALLAIANLIRSLVTLGLESQRDNSNDGFRPRHVKTRSVPHPEFLDDTGNVINEPLLVMRSMTVEDAREQLDALYESSPGLTGEPRDEV
ncbi:hypothetical protein BST81_04315 [Leptolyngbya sp. 'hensonii']|uniref:DUF2973 domain-containing protein n=1 Tax=Leptolyngbya sp. 'hensonii' TaxID=1922337 RepID=UPI00094FC6DC|nr:DUF2973 domain-containing protein [Leptolyngbya sp. 'hensonii']OLP19764.1 hypothetical protein BST81_04315 [Leptolyngbya sp. 'hensonii']